MTRPWVPYQGLNWLARAHEALADVNELTGTVYFVCSTGIRTISPWITKHRLTVLLKSLITVRIEIH